MRERHGEGGIAHQHGAGGRAAAADGSGRQPFEHGSSATSNGASPPCAPPDHELALPASPGSSRDASSALPWCRVGTGAEHRHATRTTPPSKRASRSGSSPGAAGVPATRSAPGRQLDRRGDVAHRQASSRRRDVLTCTSAEKKPFRNATWPGITMQTDQRRRAERREPASSSTGRTAPRGSRCRAGPLESGGSSIVRERASSPVQPSRTRWKLASAAACSSRSRSKRGKHDGQVDAQRRAVDVERQLERVRVKLRLVDQHAAFLHCRATAAASSRDVTRSRRSPGSAPTTASRRAASRRPSRAGCGRAGIRPPSGTAESAIGSPARTRISLGRKRRPAQFRDHLRSTLPACERADVAAGRVPRAARARGRDRGRDVLGTVSDGGRRRAARRPGRSAAP